MKVPVDVMIINGDVFTMTGDGTGYCENGAVAVEKQNIVAAGPAGEIIARYAPRVTIDASGKAVLPGLINGHFHGTITLLRGLSQDSRHWARGIEPYLELLDHDAAKAGAFLSSIEAIRNGITTIADSSPGISLALPAYYETGIRLRCSSLIRETPQDGTVLDNNGLFVFNHDAGRSWLEENLGIIETWHNRDSGRISVMLGPQSADFCSFEMLCRIGELSDTHGLMVSTHIAQDTREIDQVAKRYGKRPVEIFREAGLLNRRLIAAHLIHCTDQEVVQIAESGASMAFCPSSLLICDGILPPADIFLEAGGALCLGTDETSSNNGVNLFPEMKLASLSINLKRRDPAYLPTWKTLRLATIEGARALGLGNEIGSLEPGKKADIILVDLGTPRMLPVYRNPVRNIVPNLVLSACGGEVCLSMINGRIVYENGSLQSVNEKETLDYINTVAGIIEEKSSGKVKFNNTAALRFTREGKY